MGRRGAKQPKKLPAKRVCANRAEMSSGESEESLEQQDGRPHVETRGQVKARLLKSASSPAVGESEQRPAQQEGLPQLDAQAMRVDRYLMSTSSPVLRESEQHLAQQPQSVMRAKQVNRNPTETSSPLPTVDESEERQAQPDECDIAGPSRIDSPTRHVHENLPEEPEERQTQLDERDIAGPSQNGNPLRHVRENLPEEPEERQAQLDVCDIAGPSQTRRSRDILESPSSALNYDQHQGPSQRMSSHVLESPREAVNYGVELKKLKDEMNNEKEKLIGVYTEESNILKTWFATHPAEDPLVVHLKNMERIETGFRLLTHTQASESKHERKVAKLDLDLKNIDKEQYDRQLKLITAIQEKKEFSLLVDRDEQVLKLEYAEKRAALRVDLELDSITVEVHRLTLIDLNAEELAEKRQIKPKLEEERKRQREQQEEERKRQLRQTEEEMTFPREMAFFDYLRTITLQPGEHIRLSNNVYLGGDTTLGWLRGLYIRECYIDLCAIIFEMARVGEFVGKGEGRIARFLLQGNPGIGKSMFAFYLIYRLLKLGQTIVWQPARTKKRVLIPPLGDIVVRSAPNSFERQLDLVTTWFIIDADTPPLCAANVVLITSPRKELVHEFLKIAKPLYMPVWDLDEIERAHGLDLGVSLISGVKVTIDEARKLFETFGGIPRYVFESDTTEHLKWLDNAIDTADIIKFQNAIDGSGDAGAGYSHMVVQIHIKTPEGKKWYLSCLLKFSSEYVADRFTTHMINSREAELYAFLNDTAELAAFATPRGYVFERVAHRHIAKGGQFRVGKLQNGIAPSDVNIITLEPSTVTPFKELKQVTGQDKLYWKPEDKNFPGIDSLMGPDMLFQFTVAKRHSIKKTAIQNAAKTLSKLQKKRGIVPDGPYVIRLCFVIPASKFDEFRVQSLTDYRNRVTTAIDDVKLRVEQYVMVMVK